MPWGSRRAVRCRFPVAPRTGGMGQVARITVGRTALLRASEAHGVSVARKGEASWDQADVGTEELPDGAVEARGLSLLGLLFLSLLAAGGR